MAKGHMCGGHTARPEKFMLTILVFEIKEGKNAQKINKLTIIYHYLVVKNVTI